MANEFLASTLLSLLEEPALRMNTVMTSFFMRTCSLYHGGRMFLCFVGSAGIQPLNNPNTNARIEFHDLVTCV